MAFAVIMLVAYACGSSNTPTAVAEKATECIMNDDFEGFADLMYFTKSDKVDVKEQKEQFAALLKEKAAKNEKREKITSYETISEEIAEDGQTAVVKMKRTYGDKEKTEEMKMRKDEDGNWKVDLGK